MIDILDTAPHVLGYRVHGGVNADDIARVTRALDAQLERFERLNIYAEVTDLGSISLDALLKDIAYGLKHLGLLRRIDRAAVVTDTKWLETAARVEDRVLPFEVRHFPLTEHEAARAWVSADEATT